MKATSSSGAFATLRRRFNLHRLPLATLVVFAITATTSLLQLVVPGMLSSLQRSPAGLHGDWWRSFTSLFVQDGGAAGTVSKLAFLLVLGVLTEQVVSRPRWVASYFGAGLVGEIAGYAWQPHGAGNSVAVCGLAGVLVAVLGFEDPETPSLSPLFLIYWCGALLGDAFWPGYALLFAAMPMQLAISQSMPIGRLVAALAIATGVALAAMQNIHGAALLAGIFLGALLLRTESKHSEALRGSALPDSPAERTTPRGIGRNPSSSKSGRTGRA